MTEKKSLVEAAEDAKAAVKAGKTSVVTTPEGASAIELLTRAVERLENTSGKSAKTFHNAAQELQALIDRLKSRGGA